MREHDPLLLGLQQGLFLRVWVSVTTWNSRNPSESHQNDADIALDARLPEQTRSQATRLPESEFKSEGRFFDLFTVYISLDLSTVYLSLFVYVCVYVLFGSPSTCEVNVFFEFALRSRSQWVLIQVVACKNQSKRCPWNRESCGIPEKWFQKVTDC